MIGLPMANFECRMDFWTTPRTIKAAMAGFALYFAIAVYVKYSYVPLPTPKFARSSGYSFIATEFGLDEIADSPENPTRSPVILLENGKPLGPPHSAHADIRDIGHGRFSHWRGIGIIFSASDNSNPNVNGRKYDIMTPASQ
jgi:hypothetical protein